MLRYYNSFSLLYKGIVPYFSDYHTFNIPHYSFPLYIMIERSEKCCTKYSEAPTEPKNIRFLVFYACKLPIIVIKTLTQAVLHTQPSWIIPYDSNKWPKYHHKVSSLGLFAPNRSICYPERGKLPQLTAYCRGTRLKSQISYSPTNTPSFLILVSVCIIICYVIVLYSLLLMYIGYFSTFLCFIYSKAL